MSLFPLDSVILIQILVKFSWHFILAGDNPDAALTDNDIELGRHN